MIRVENVSRIYSVGEQSVKALDDVSISVRKGEYVAIMGPSGSGKSTMMNILGCLDSPTCGAYYLEGTDVSQMDDDRLSDVRNRQIGFVFQAFNLLPRYTALENVALPLVYAGVEASRREELSREALVRVGLEDRMEHRPGELSGGQRQRVAVARAIINHPSIILADEPTGNLDTKTSVDIMRLLGQIHDMGNTVILVTHEEDISRYAHRIIRFRDGRVESDSVNPNPTIS
ncbi:MAG: ABC transporter ATP-binding protein [Bacteroidales bacterium]|nr:ABC transporter ATP-binding protein [Bacteroidales bacterium]